MPSLTKIADVLVRYANGGLGNIPKIHLNFTHDPTDIDVDGWNLAVVLEGYDNLDAEGHIIPTYTKTWESAGSDPEECLKRVAVTLAEALTTALAIKNAESEAVKDALIQLKSTRDAAKDLPTLWPQTKEQAEAVEAAEETRDEQEPGQAWEGTHTP